MKGRWRRKCPCTLAWARLAARWRAQIFGARVDTAYARGCSVTETRRDERLTKLARLGQDERGLSRLGLVSLETVLARLNEEPGSGAAWASSRN